MKLSERESIVLLSLHDAKLIGLDRVTTKMIAVKHGMNVSQAYAAVYSLRSKHLATQPGDARYAITRAGVKEAEKLKGDPDVS